MGNSYWCRWCHDFWPMTEDFKLCPRCREPALTRWGQTMDEEHAHELRLEYAFGWWLWDTGRL